VQPRPSSRLFPFVGQVDKDAQILFEALRASRTSRTALRTGVRVLLTLKDPVCERDRCCYSAPVNELLRLHPPR
jgi:hypothetical protein